MLGKERLCWCRDKCLRVFLDRFFHKVISHIQIMLVGFFSSIFWESWENFRDFWVWLSSQLGILLVLPFVDLEERTAWKDKSCGRHSFQIRVRFILLYVKNMHLSACGSEFESANKQTVRVQSKHWSTFPTWFLHDVSSHQYLPKWVSIAHRRSPPPFPRSLIICDTEHCTVSTCNLVVIYHDQRSWIFH